MFVVYVYSKCSTCQKALELLAELQVPFTRREITQTPPSLEELQQMLRYVGGDIKKLFNTSGLQYRALGLSAHLPTMPQEEALKLLASHGMLVKRPFLLGPKSGLVGFKAQQWQLLLACT